MSKHHLDQALADLLSTFNDLNCNVVEELDEEPSPLEFMRYVARNHPFVVRRGAAGWKAVQQWDRAYLVSALEGQSVNVAVTPFGNADSPTVYPESQGDIVFAKPHQEDQPFQDFLDYVIQQETDASFSSANTEVRYAQTQNDNFRDEYLSLFPDAQRDIPFARIALQKPPEAVNLWIGNSKSITAIHKDNYENVYVQAVGRKHFLLLPPISHCCMNERPLHPATYVRKDQGLALELDQDPEPVPFATWDPDQPTINPDILSHLAKPLRVTLEPGDMLYLPAMWYHKVTQSCADDDEGFVVAINYWYDMDFSGPLYPLANFTRNLSLGSKSRST